MDIAIIIDSDNNVFDLMVEYEKAGKSYLFRNYLNKLQLFLKKASECSKI